MKKIWEKPKVLFGLDPSEGDSDTGGGTGQSGQMPYPCDFTEWLDMFGENLDFDSDIDFDDYREWWHEMEFGEELWRQYNGDAPFNP